MTAPSRGDRADAQDAGDRTPATTRRRFVRAAGAGVAATGLGVGVSGSAAGQQSEGIPTPWLERDGNLFRDPQGNPVTLRGVNIADPARLDNTDQRYHVSGVEVTKRALDESNGWYNRIVRIPVQTGDITDSGKNEVEPGVITQSELQSYVEDHLRPVVDECATQGAYCIVDYHRHDDAQLLYTDDALDEEVTMFWETVAPEFAEDSHVLFEVYNEPIAPYPGHNSYGQDAGVDVTESAAEDTWLTWRDAAQPWVNTIREHAPRNPIVVGSPRWTQWTYWADEHEFEGENLGYAGHVYAHENLRPLEEYFGKPAENVPVFMTEFGYDDEGQSFLKGTTSVEGEEFRTFFENHPHVHWQVWCFDPRWQPAMFSEDQGEWTVLGGEDYHGEFFKAYLQEKQDDRVPGGGGEPSEVPTAPGDQWTNEVTSTSIDLGWEAVEDADTYVVSVDGSEYDGTSSTSTTITGLTPDTQYDVGIASSNAAGTSEPVSTTITTAEEGTGEGPTCGGQPVNATTTVDGQRVCDVDGDELFRDIDGNGEVSHADVQEFFSVQHRPTWKQPSAFDFNENEVVGHGDVLALFEHVATGGL